MIVIEWILGLAKQDKRDDGKYIVPGFYKLTRDQKGHWVFHLEDGNFCYVKGKNAKDRDTYLKSCESMGLIKIIWNDIKPKNRLTYRLLKKERFKTLKKL